MKITNNIGEARRFRRSKSENMWGLVPTMGYLHEGHLSLVRRAREENDSIAVSIYVNPKQFAPSEDLDTYPRDLDRDLAQLNDEHVDLVFTPNDGTMYPTGFQSSVKVTGLTQPLEGQKRPAHFEGVTTIVAKLFNIIQPARAYFGQKDAQQASVIRQMVRDLNFPLEIVVCPIIRESDGLAMSSRNKFLTREQRSAATVLSRALSTARREAIAGEQSAANLRELMRSIVEEESLATLDYVNIVDPLSFGELEQVHKPALLLIAVYFGSTRLIDNVLL